MNAKNKVIATLFVSLLVFGGGGVYLYNQYTNPSKAYEVISTDIYIDQSSIIPQGKLPVNARKGTRGISASTNNTQSGSGLTLSADNTFSAATPANSSSSKQLLSGTSYSYSAPKEDPSIISGGGSPMLLAYGGSSNRSSGSSLTSTSDAVASTSGTLSRPLLVPFTGTPNTSQALVDPGTDSFMEMIVPVGEGWWVLVLLSLGYFLYYRRKR